MAGAAHTLGWLGIKLVTLHMPALKWRMMLLKPAEWFGLPTLHASTRTWRNNFRMATEAKRASPKTPAALTNPVNRGSAHTPEELAELLDSLREDEIAAEAANSTNYDPE